ncbi:MAG: hypothetical protein A3B13_00805 [Candidatus Liptonbacteria bacterium RIFCSPLOWO2_01_FULL_45_15]|uniref:Uncharacterized protein n=1 Tax=Candidatus Liptonbacteria bacterium RIFCSPLOWO2_01_FULL_45_15 TaxID=1798649 RepID=A0A1G2CH67_9BACT|nr:MAG: hypothetical protein A3B13_00805 [Candidatus Liptonbacteria bacterium RIFCSPLOWO2_01_FULL_45_15]
MGFFDKLEDKIRFWFSHYPIFYGFIGGIGAVLFWRGVWHTADYISLYFLNQTGVVSTTDFGSIWDGLISFVIGSVLLLITGLFVSNFIGNEIIISGLRGERKLAEKTEKEVRTETGAIAEIREEIKKISKTVEEIKNKK